MHVATSAQKREKPLTLSPKLRSILVATPSRHRVPSVHPTAVVRDVGHVIPYTGSNDKEGSDVSVGLWWAGTPALSIIVNRMIMRLFDVGCASSGLLSLRSPPGATILELFDAHSIHTYGFPLLSPRVSMRVTIYERIPETTNYNASASDASSVSNEMQEVRARVVHRRNVWLRERV
ncbi:hypothetical protein G5I_09175 [Acromyrmex echinatior]|uniref:Uncharacterized protein n=1 Tax=Acromyrmex echinatior TaxID=103372 RepID=F4WTH7_ACREC|nr:hypothetical protein G5I_09175 [Acromyrmex echinatior]